ncbi:uncharacterized protein CC84DRAFT_1218216 [Paraphaeosphaeria sporulosa]|uniref:Uncharacterized protein n=1 Tax=Paraphaeosphaeria sporulosa TaxID=1460663 RepID=A0A177CAL9_9PLEO|nr:uncharacterized protein CC84DRAFT_1218216 [Paraphaeosphaeria sporulosa]OAG04794.1 hypothetical protein CC84DRAFT_1218216 [Paraphaeosphaeria sporulosa]
MCSSTAHIAHSSDKSTSTTKRDPGPTTPSAIPLPPSPPQDTTTKGGDSTPATPAIAIPQSASASASKLKASFPAGWPHSNTNLNTAAPAKTGFSVPVGRPKTPRSRNRRGLTISTPLPNPFLNVRASESPEKNRPLSSKMTTPAESPTTPNSRMIFKMDDEEK